MTYIKAAIGFAIILVSFFILMKNGNVTLLDKVMSQNKKRSCGTGGCCGSDKSKEESTDKSCEIK